MKRAIRALAKFLWKFRRGGRCNRCDQKTELVSRGGGMYRWCGDCCIYLPVA